MAKDKLVKVMLVMIAVLLLCNVFNEQISSFFSKEAAAQSSAQSLDFRGNGVALFCSSDGRYVYAASSQAIFRSLDYGKPGSWEQVITGKR